MNYLISRYITRYFFHDKWYYYHYQLFLLSLSMILPGNGKDLICGMVFFICEHCIIFSLCLLKISLFWYFFYLFHFSFFLLSLWVFIIQFLLFLLSCAGFSSLFSMVCVWGGGVGFFFALYWVVCVAKFLVIWESKLLILESCGWKLSHQEICFGILGLLANIISFGVRNDVRTCGFTCTCFWIYWWATCFNCIINYQRWSHRGHWWKWIHWSCWFLELAIIGHANDKVLFFFATICILCIYKSLPCFNKDM